MPCYGGHSEVLGRWKDDLSKWWIGGEREGGREEVLGCRFVHSFVSVGGSGSAAVMLSRSVCPSVRVFSPSMGLNARPPLISRNGSLYPPPAHPQLDSNGWVQMEAGWCSGLLARSPLSHTQFVKIIVLFCFLSSFKEKLLVMVFFAELTVSSLS